MNGASGGQNGVSYSKDKAEVSMNRSRKIISNSKTLDSIASLPRAENLLEFRRNGVLLLAKSDHEGNQGDLLCPGVLTITRKTPFQHPVFEWTPEEQQCQKEPEQQYGASFSDREWTLVNDQLTKRNVRPIEFELCELKSFRLSDDGNRMVLILRDGTRHPPLIFLDEGPEELICVMKR